MLQRVSILISTTDFIVLSKKGNQQPKHGKRQKGIEFNLCENSKFLKKEIGQAYIRREILPMFDFQ